MRSVFVACILGLALAACGGGMEVPEDADVFKAPCQPVVAEYDGRPCNFRLPAGMECASITSITVDGIPLREDAFDVMCGPGVLVLRTPGCATARVVLIGQVCE